MRRGASFFAFFPFNAKVPANLNIFCFFGIRNAVDKQEQKLYNDNDKKDTTTQTSKHHEGKEGTV